MKYDTFQTPLIENANSSSRTFSWKTFLKILSVLCICAGIVAVVMHFQNWKFPQPLYFAESPLSDEGSDTECATWITKVSCEVEDGCEWKSEKEDGNYCKDDGGTNAEKAPKEDESQDAPQEDDKEQEEEEAESTTKKPKKKKKKKTTTTAKPTPKPTPKPTKKKTTRKPKPVLKHKGQECWYDCHKSGNCGYCGSGKCCRKAHNGRHNACGWWGGCLTKHCCVA